MVAFRSVRNKNLGFTLYALRSTLYALRSMLTVEAERYQRGEPINKREYIRRRFDRTTEHGPHIGSGVESEAEVESKAFTFSLRVY